MDRWMDGWMDGWMSGGRAWSREQTSDLELGVGEPWLCHEADATKLRSTLE